MPKVHAFCVAQSQGSPTGRGHTRVNFSAFHGGGLYFFKVLQRKFKINFLCSNFY